LNINQTQTIKAIAAAPGFTNSAVATGAYTIPTPPAATPTFSPAGGTYTSPQSVVISDSTPGAPIYYTTDGTNPSRASPQSMSHITGSSSETIRALATATGYSTSAQGAATYTIQSTGTTVNFGTGFTASSGMTLNGSTQLNGTGLLLTNGGQYQAGSTWYST